MDFNGEHGKMVEEESVRTIFQMFMRGKGMKEIVEFLDRCSWPDGKPYEGSGARDAWTEQEIQEILQDPYNKELVGEYVWYQAQRQLGSAGHRRPPENPLEGLVFCQRCGRKMVSEGPGRHVPYAVLRCPSRRCGNGPIPLELVEQKILVALAEWCRLYQKEAKGADGIYATLELCKEALLEVDGELVDMRGQLEEIIVAQEQAGCQSDIFQQKKKRIKRGIDRLRIRRDELESRLRSILSMADIQAQLAPKILHLLEAYGSLGIGERSRLLRETLLRVDVKRTEKGQEDGSFTLSISPRVPQETS